MGRAHPVYTKPTQFIQRVARRYVVAAFIAGLGPASVAVSAAVEAPVQQVRWQMCIGRSPLSDALMQVARRIGVQVARLADVGSTNIVVGPVCGLYTRDEALTALLQGTGLTYQFVNDHTVAIIRQAVPAPAARNSPPPTQLPPTSAPAQGGTDSAANNIDQGGHNMGTVTDNSRHQNLLSRLLGLFAVCGVASLSPGQTCAQEATSSDALQEVVVTAERRSTDIQTTPVSVTAISGADLLDRHIDVIGDLETQVPGLSVTNSGFTQNINIRGMGNSTASPTVTTGVPVYRDGLYQPEAILLTEPFYDIADVRDIARTAGDHRRTELHRWCADHQLRQSELQRGEWLCRGHRWQLRRAQGRRCDQLTGQRRAGGPRGVQPRESRQLLRGYRAEPGGCLRAGHHRSR